MLQTQVASFAYAALLMVILANLCQGTLTNSTTTLFSWPAYASLTYATPLPKLTRTPTYARGYSALSTINANQTTTTWASIASPTDTAAKYGNVAWSAQWSIYTNVTSPPFTTTPSATSIPSSELIKPTTLPFPIQDSHKYTFPKDFLYGFAGAALQVEGAIKNEGRGPSLTEIGLISREQQVKGGGPPDVTNLNYYLYKQDIARLAAVGVKTYSFSISWSRILPFATPGSPVNKEAIDHYDDLINTILDYGMTPVATLHHFDTPYYYATNTSWQGWDHPEFIEGFVNYAKIVLTHYSDRVGTWISFNEPGTDKNLKNWASAWNVIMAHAQVVHWYRDVINGTGKWSMKLSFTNGFAIPLDPGNPADVAAAQRYTEFQTGYFTNPLFLNLQTPESVVSALGSKAPYFTDEELSFVKGTCDFLAVDLYSASYHSPLTDEMESCISNSSNPLYPYCVNTTFWRDGWDIGTDGDGTVYLFYQHFRSIIKYMASSFPSEGGIMITEFGFPAWSQSSMPLEQARTDMMQSIYYQTCLQEILKSIYEDGVNVIGAIGWSFVDNWEWGEYDDRYGVQAFNHTTLERYYKRSIFDFVDFIETNME